MFMITGQVIVALMLVACGGAVKAGTSGSGSDTTSQEGKASVAAQQRITDTVTIAMTGDIMTGSIYPRYIMPADEGKSMFVDCSKILQEADVACGNLEGVLADKGSTRKAPGPLSFSFMMPTKSVQLLVDAGYDFLGIANNHIYDFWDAGVQSTINTLRQAGIGVAGTKACESVVREIGGVKYGFCAFGHESYSLMIQDTATVKRVITSLRPQCDILIVCFHGGAEGTNCRHVPQGVEFFHGDNRGDVRQFTHLCIDSGADIVFGSGPHVPRAMELYNDHLIAYSLGNFATCGMSVAAQTGHAPLLVARLDGNGRFVGGRIHSFIQGHRTGPRLDTRNVVARDIQSLTREDFKDTRLDIADDGTLTIKK